MSGAAVGVPPVEISFTASNYYPRWNATSTLSWNVLYSASLSIDQDIGAVSASGSLGQIGQSQTRTYTLTALGLNGITYTSSLTITWAALACIWEQFGYPEWC